MSRLRVRVLLAAVALGAAVVSGPTAVANATPAQDQLLYDVMYQNGIVLYPQAYGQAQRACGVMWGGYGTPDAVVDAFLSMNPGWTYDQARVLVAAAIAIYCPPADVAPAVAVPAPTYVA
jgi:hypothetical protein